MQFQAFPKLSRLSKQATITEKIDGTNAAVIIVPVDGPVTRNGNDITHTPSDGALCTLGGFHIGAQSRNRLLDTSAKGDHFGFAKWVVEHAPELVKLGPGAHSGEWWGLGIGRRYGQTEKRFSLFNAARWNDQNPNRPSCCSVVPILARCSLDKIDDVMADLKRNGSRAAPGFMNPEGIVVFYEGTMYKKTFEHDKGKWSAPAAIKEPGEV